MKLMAKAVEKLRHHGSLHFRDIKDTGTPGLYLRMSDAAMEIVHEAAALRTAPWLLPASGSGGHVPPSGVLQAAQRIHGSGVTVHDLRRTTGTGLQRLGIRLEVTEAVLNHVSGTRAGVVGIYQRHDWSTEKRAALDALARRILALAACEPARDNVKALAGVA
jgi:hypothetical protein